MKKKNDKQLKKEEEKKAQWSPKGMPVVKRSVEWERWIFDQV